MTSGSIQDFSTVFPNMNFEAGEWGIITIFAIWELFCSSTDFENPVVVNKMLGIFQGTTPVAGATNQVFLWVELYKNKL